MKSIAAWTEDSGKAFPEYVNFSVDGEDVLVTLRETPVQIHSGHLINGRTASVRVPLAQFWVMINKARQELLV